MRRVNRVLGAEPDTQAIERNRSDQQRSAGDVLPARVGNP
jgi:hypothetical protein